MIAGKTTINDDVFIELAKINLAQIHDVDVKIPPKKILSSISKIFSSKTDDANKQNDFPCSKKNIIVTCIRVTTKHSPDGLYNSHVTFDLNIEILSEKESRTIIHQLQTVLINATEKHTGYQVEKTNITIDKIGV